MSDQAKAAFESQLELLEGALATIRKEFHALKLGPRTDVERVTRINSALDRAQRYAKALNTAAWTGRVQVIPRKRTWRELWSGW